MREVDDDWWHEIFCVLFFFHPLNVWCLLLSVLTVVVRLLRLVTVLLATSYSKIWQYIETPPSGVLWRPHLLGKLKLLYILPQQETSADTILRERRDYCMRKYRSKQIYCIVLWKCPKLIMCSRVLGTTRKY